MAKISTIKQAISVLRNANVTPFIWGHRGVGKSSAVKQYCAENNLGFIDLRCSQLEASDIRGLPEAHKGQTRYLPPADMPTGDMAIEEAHRLLLQHQAYTPEYQAVFERIQPKLERGILFLDELNRAADDVLQAAFQLVLDRRVGQYILPKGWSIVAAGNFMEGYTVSNFNDPAFINRFCHITLSDGDSTLEEWINYMVETHGELAADVINFTTTNLNHLDGDVKGELGFSIQPSRRSWDAVVRVDKAIASGNYSQEVRYTILTGLVGHEMAAAYISEVCPVKPQDVLEKGVKQYLKKITGLRRGQLLGLTWGIASFAKKDLNEKIITVCLDYAEALLKVISDKDIIVAFCKSLLNHDIPTDAKVGAALLINPEFAKLISQYRPKNRAKRFLDYLTEREQLHELIKDIVGESK